MPLIKSNPIVEPADSAATTTVGTDTVTLSATDVSGRSNYTVYVQNLGVTNAFTKGELQASPFSTGPWAAIDTSLNTLATETNGAIEKSNNSVAWIRFIASSTATTARAHVSFGVEQHAGA